MFRFLTSLGSLVVFSRRHKTVRKTVIFLVTNFTAIASIIFSIEVILIILGVRNISLPLGRHTLQILTRLFF
jgi:hypothetical protein